MGQLFMVGVDGSDGCRRAVDFAADQAARAGADLLLVHVIEWSRYEFLSPPEVAERHRQRERELEDAQTRLLDPLSERLKAAGAEPRTVIRFGHGAEELCSAAAENNACQVFIGRRGRSRVTSLLFGGVAGALVQIASVPVTVVP
ncbi:universal stress protein [Skermanella pratensis]|uniref:universal stress protein n=1 Tax=Skermanella pratensis TaxID=2233999 RepID=UPI0013018F83|nr:universal stress protein [Skermanella pratensis]